ncbi:MAG: lysoplasmalogenase [Spirochaetia bacterium]|nr:lysoplasmalogenase [Spirochaetia bacterium]
MVIFLAVVFILASAAIYVRYFKPKFYFLAKPLPIICIILSMLFYYPQIKAEHRILFWFFEFGFILSLAGDIFLLDKRNFLYGLMSFLTAHIFYLAGFYFNVEHTYPSFFFNSIIILISFLYAYFLIKNILKKNQSKYIVPVVIYILLITVMCLLAYQFYLANKNTGIYFVTGALLFYLSDFTLSYNKFVKEFYFAQFIILLTYYTAQTLFTLGIIRL